MLRSVEIMLLRSLHEEHEKGPLKKLCMRNPR